jgi:hypothetical protein
LKNNVDYCVGEQENAILANDAISKKKMFDDGENIASCDFICYIYFKVMIYFFPKNAPNIE